MIILLLTHLVVSQTYKLLHTVQLEISNSASGIVNVEHIDDNLLLVFEFVDANYPLALVSLEEINEKDFNRTLKPIFIESKKNLSFDYESLQIHYHTHIIELPYAEQVYYFVKDGFGKFKVKIDVYGKGQSTCINNCQGFQVNLNSTSSHCSEQCQCTKDYFGSYCQFPRIEIKQDEKIHTQLIPHQPVYLSFQLNDQAILIADDVIDPITASFGIMGIRGYELPDQTSYTAILHNQISLTKLMASLKQQFQNATTLIIGLQCKTEQNITLLIKQDQNAQLWSGNCMFFIFAIFNIFIILVCFAITSLCKKDEKIQKKKRKLKIRPPMIDQKPKNFSGSFFSKYFEIFDYLDFIAINPQFSSTTECVVCMEDLKIKEISVSPCEHLFHHQCLKKWLMKELTCPSCRFKINYDLVLQGGWIGSKITGNQKQNNSQCILMVNENCQEHENCNENCQENDNCQENQNCQEHDICQENDNCQDNCQDNGQESENLSFDLQNVSKSND